MRASALKLALELAERPSTSSIELAKALWAAENQEGGSIRQFVALYPSRRRRAYYLYAIWKRFAALDIPERQLARVGWSKLAIIAQHCEAGMEPSGIDLALRYTAAELKRALQAGKHPTRKTYSLLFRFSPSQYKLLRRALIVHGATSSKNGRGLDGKEKALIEVVKAAQG